MKDDEALAASARAALAELCKHLNALRKRGWRPEVEFRDFSCEAAEMLNIRSIVGDLVITKKMSV